MGWTLDRSRKHLLLGPAHPESAVGETISYRESPYDPGTTNYALDLSATVRRLGAVLKEPTADLIVTLIMRQIPPLVAGTAEVPQKLILGVDWTSAHTPRRAMVNVHRARSNPPQVVDTSVITPTHPIDFAAVMSTSVAKRFFFGLVVIVLLERLRKLEVRDVDIVFLTNEGKRHHLVFDGSGVLTETETDRTDWRGEADLSVPLEIKRAGPGLKWELHTVDWDAAFVVSLMRLENVNIRLSKVEPYGHTADPKKRPRPLYEIINGEVLCSHWNSRGDVIARIAAGNTDYTRNLTGYGIPSLMNHTDAINAAVTTVGNSIVVHPQEFVAAIRAARTKRGSKVWIAPGNIIHLTSRTAPHSAVKQDRSGNMLHDELVAILWTAAYFSGATRQTSGKEWQGPSVDLNGLRLWAENISIDQALSGATTPARPVEIAYTE